MVLDVLGDDGLQLCVELLVILVSSKKRKILASKKIDSFRGPRNIYASLCPQRCALALVRLLSNLALLKSLA
jgi:hypothetical protein